MIREHCQTLGTRPLCEAFQEPRSSYYRSLYERPSVSETKRSSPRSLTDLEQG
jgi:hypothetical protein